MALVNLQTDLKSLTFGKDQPGGGSSNQPYIQTPIPTGDLPVNSPDILLRDGFKSPVAIGRDISRITQMFKDPKSPTGLLFITKQNLLSRISVKTQSTTRINPSYLGGVINQGIYSPTSTIAQVAVEDFGTHLNFLGVDPTGLSGTGINDYEKIIKRQTRKWDTDVTKENQGEKNNRLVALKHRKISLSPTSTEDLKFIDKVKNSSLFNKFNISTNPLTILNYGGGPGSILGIDLTSIKFADGQRTGYDSDRYIKDKSFFNDSNRPDKKDPEKYPPIKDFRKEKLDSLKDKTSTIMSIAPSYRPNENKTIDNSTGNSRINYTSPGQKGNVYNYTNGKRDLITRKKIGNVDKINALPIYQSDKGVHTTPEVNDLVQFRIAAIDNTIPSKKNYIHFRAYIDSFSDNYNGSWDAINYMGRGESFWKYSNFKRNIALSFTVAAQSREELIPMYRKLNYLVSNLAPTYSTEGYMAGSLVTLTLGGWCYELPGFITSMTLDVPMESPWEIGIDTEGNIDQNVKELPHIVKVSGFSFIPIERFRPSKQKIDFTKKNEELGIEGGKAINYGDEQYIALKDKIGNNYNYYEELLPAPDLSARGDFPYEG